MALNLKIKSLPKQLTARRWLIRSALTTVALAMIVYFSAHSLAPKPPTSSILSLESSYNLQGEPPRQDPAQENKPQQPQNPASLSIAKLSIENAPIVPVGIESNGEMSAPAHGHQIGWYKKGPTPGQDKGAILLDGHVTLRGQAAVFANLQNLTTGDEINLTRHDGQAFRFTVYHVEQLPLKSVDMRKMMHSVDPTRQGLNIITCGGEYNADLGTYADRVIVYAVANYSN